MISSNPCKCSNSDTKSYFSSKRVHANNFCANSNDKAPQLGRFYREIAKHSGVSRHASDEVTAESYWNTKRGSQIPTDLLKGPLPSHERAQYSKPLLI